MARVCSLILVLILLEIPNLHADDKDFISLPANLIGDSLAVHFDFAAFLTADDSASLVEGEDLSIICRLELWQKRKLWFDRLRTEITGYFRIGYDRWQERFILSTLSSRGEAAEKFYTNLDSLLDDMKRVNQFTFVLEPADHERESYLAYSLDLKYLTPGKLGNLKEWLLKGERSNTANDETRKTSLPNKLIALALNSAGFKNRTFLRSSLSFFPLEIRGEIWFPKSVN